jgi:hypothetical protein
MANKTFILLAPHQISKIIHSATKRVILACAGINADVAASIIGAVDRCGADNVALITDLDEDVYRLGYGHFDGITLLKEKMVPIRKAPGLRIGILVCDDDGWVFSTPPLLVEDIKGNDKEPNAVRVSTEQAEAFVRVIVPTDTSAAPTDDDPSAGDGEQIIDEEGEPISDDDAENSADGLGDTPTPIEPRGEDGSREGENDTDNESTIDVNDDGPEIGEELATDGEIEDAEKNLEDDPPQEFDITRKVRVFNSYLQFVELRLSGTQIQRNTVKLPPNILLSVNDKDTQDRINAAFKLIEKSSEVSGEEIKSKVDNLRKSFLRRAGEYGSLILRKKRKKFDEAIIQLEKDVNIFKETVKEKLDLELEKSKQSLAEALVSNIVENPPLDLLAMLTTDKPSKEIALRYLLDELTKAFPTSESLIKDMELKHIIKDVTYATLNEEKFQELIQRAFPYTDFDKPFEEFDAARERARKKGSGYG